jgi:O-antigen ligase
MIFFSITLFESIVGILQFILQKPLGFSLLKEPLFGVEINTSAKIFISQKNQIFFNALSIVDNNCFLRAHGTFIHPNVFSGFLNVSSLLTLYLIYKSKRKLIFSLFLFIQLTSLILTFSRAGFISFICSSFLFFLLMFIKKYDVKKMLITFLIVLVLVGCLFSKYLIERGYFGHFFQSNEAKEINLGSSNVRILLKNVSINMIKQNPYFGIGFRNFLIKRGEYTSQITERAYVHNIYLLIAAETGIISFFVFLIFLILIFVNTLKCCLNPLTITSICIVISFLLIGFFDHYPISSYFGRMILFVFLGFLNYSITINKLFSYSQKVLLCQ